MRWHDLHFFAPFFAQALRLHIHTHARAHTLVPPVRCAPVDTPATFVRVSQRRVGCLDWLPSVRDSVCQQQLRLSRGVFVHLSCCTLMHT